MLPNTTQAQQALQNLIPIQLEQFMPPAVSGANGTAAVAGQQGQLANSANIQQQLEQQRQQLQVRN